MDIQNPVLSSLIFGSLNTISKELSAISSDNHDPMSLGAASKLHSIAVTVSGPPVSLASATLTAGTYTLELPDDPSTLITSSYAKDNTHTFTISTIPSSSKFTIGTHTFSVVFNVAVIDHTTLTKGASGTSLDDMFISLGPSGLVVATSTDIPAASSNTSITAEGLAALIMSGFSAMSGGSSGSLDPTGSMSSSATGNNGSSVVPVLGAAAKGCKVGYGMMIAVFVSLGFCY